VGSNQITMDIGQVAKMAKFRLLKTLCAGRALEESSDTQSDPAIVKITSPCLYLLPTYLESVEQ